MPQNTTYNPERTSEFSKNYLNFNGQSIRGTANASGIVTADFTLTDDHLLTGGVLIVKDARIDDKVSFQIVHPSFGVVNQFVTDYGMSEDTQVQFNINLEYPAKIFAGLTIRCKYEASDDKAERKFVLNLRLHKIIASPQEPV